MSTSSIQESIPTESAESSRSASAGDLTTGAKAGIGVGVAAVVVLAIALSAWLVLHYRKGRGQKHEDMLSSATTTAGHPAPADCTS